MQRWHFVWCRRAVGKGVLRGCFFTRLQRDTARETLYDSLAVCTPVITFAERYHYSCCRYWSNCRGGCYWALHHAGKWRLPSISKPGKQSSTTMSPRLFAWTVNTEGEHFAHDNNAVIAAESLLGVNRSPIGGGGCRRFRPRRCRQKSLSRGHRTALFPTWSASLVRVELLS